MPVLVTGGAGFIGSNLVDELMAQNMEVRVVDDLSEGKMGNLERWKNHKNFQFIKGSILDYELLKRACDRVTCVFHLAADSRIQTGITDPRHSIQTNVVGTANVAEAARQAGVSRIVYSASSSAYGRTPMPDDGFNESCKTDCLNPYSMSKKAGEDVMDVYNRLYGLSTVSLRYFNVYGPRHQEDGRYATVIAIFRRQQRLGQKMTVVGDGEQRRDFTFVGDIVRANMLSMMNRDVTGVFNIGTGENYSINQLAAVVSGEPLGTAWMNEVEYIAPRLGEAQVTLANNTRAKDTLGWKPQVNLQQGIQVLDGFEKKMGAGNSGLILVAR
jgi:UDP-glucose 4-epimerase